MMPSYPALLPHPIRTAYARQYAQKQRVVRMDDGTGRTRRMLYGQPFSMSLTWRFTDLELSIFEAFLEYECSFGTKWFDMQVSPVEPTVSVKLMGGAPQVKSAGAGWEATAAVMVVAPGVPAPPSVIIHLWPTALPLPEKDNYSYQKESYFIQSNLQVGMPDSRSRFTNKEVVFTAGWLMTLAERNLFWEFARVTLLDCTMPFMMWFQNGQGVDLIKCKFSNFPKESENGTCFRIEATFSTMYAPKMLFSEYLDAINATAESTYAIDYFLEDYTEVAVI